MSSIEVRIAFLFILSDSQAGQTAGPQPTIATVGAMMCRTMEIFLLSPEYNAMPDSGPDDPPKCELLSYNRM